MKNLSILKFYRTRDWIKNLGITFIGILASENVNINLHKGIIALLLSSFLLAYAFSLNDYFDWKIGKEKNYMSRLKIKKKKKIILILFPLFLSIFFLLTFFIDKLMILLAFFLFFFLYTLYSSPPRLKKTWKYSLFANAFCLGIALFWIGYFSQVNHLNKAFFIFSFFHFSYILTCEIIHQISHMRKDKIGRIESFPIAFGIKNGVQLAQSVQYAVIGFSLTWMLLQQKIFLISLSMMFFSMFRILKIKKINNISVASRLREKMYGMHEGLFYSFLLFINYFLKFSITLYLF
jgi:4-hydroxybenzoate polyprenyltransferase